jgi:hypothetical protein
VTRRNDTPSQLSRQRERLDGGRLEEISSTLTLPFLDAAAATEPDRSPIRRKLKISPFPTSDAGR